MAEELGYRNRDVLHNLYWKEDLSTHQMASRLNVSHVCILKWMKKHSIPRRRNRNYLIASAKQPSWELGYILGVLCGDGSPFKSGHHYRAKLATVDLQWAQFFWQLLYAWAGFKPQKLRSDLYRSPFGVSLMYVVILQSKDAYLYFTSLGKFKTENWAVPNIVWDNGRKIQQGFISGFYDSEGSPITNREYGQISVVSSNKDGLLDIRDLLRKNNFHPTNLTKKYCFCLCRRDELIRYRDEIGFKIERKREKLSRLTQARGLNDG